MDELDARRLLDLVVEYVNAAADEQAADTYGLDHNPARGKQQIAADFARAVEQVRRSAPGP